MLDRSLHSVLIVDDHDGSRYALVRGVQAAGYHTLQASTGAQALELAPYASAVILDVHLPDLYGIEVCRILRSLPGTARLPIIHISSIGVHQALSATSREAGANLYMPAPAEREEVVAALDRLIDPPAR